MVGEKGGGGWAYLDTNYGGRERIDGCSTVVVAVVELQLFMTLKSI